MRGRDLLVTPGTRLIHIGPQKTGTTSIQRAFYRVRDQVAEHGVQYTGHTTHSTGAALYAVGGRSLVGMPPPRAEDWAALCEDVERAGDKRVVISSEYFAAADRPAAEEILRGVGGSHPHVVVTLRRLLQITPSQWQQYVRNRARTSYEDTLQGLLNEPPYNKPYPSFWRRHDHAAMIQRWADVVGAENLTVVVLDDADRDMVLRTFEALVGLPTGLLQVPEHNTNRSLTYGEAEFVLRMNHEFLAHGWSDRTYHRSFRKAVVKRIQAGHRPGPDEPRIRTPRWAAERLTEINIDIADQLDKLGVRIIGDLDVLRQPPAESEVASDPLPAPTLPVETAVEAVTGALIAGEAEAERRARDAARTAARAARRARATAGPAVSELTSAQLLRTVLRRIERRITRRFERRPQRRSRDG